MFLLLQRTERINRETMTLLKPEEFARVLCEKLEKVIRDRELAEEAAKETNLPVSVSNPYLTFAVNVNITK